MTPLRSWFQRNALGLVLVLVAACITVGAVEIARLGRVESNFAVSQKASTQTRIVTVAARCNLTQLILGVLVRIHDSRDAAPFQRSLNECVDQLASVKAINAATH